MDVTNLNSFLKLGYFIDYHNKEYQLNYSHIDRLKYHEYSEQDLIDLCAWKFKHAIAKNFKLKQKHLLPLSGGLDSRAILAALLEFTQAKNINTYTFGTPGTFDYEIGNFVAKVVGTTHVSFPLTEYKYDQNELLDISNQVDHQTVLFHHPPMWEIDKRFGHCQVWSGYIGDAVTGGHLPNNISKTIFEVKKKYLKKFPYVTSINLTNCEDNDFLDHINFDWIEKSKLSFEEQMLYQERVQKLTAPHVLMKGYRYNTPFINNAFMDFMFSIDDRYRRHQYLYRKMLVKTFPELFKLKTKTNYGLSLDASKLTVFFRRALNKGKRTANRFASLFVNQDINYLNFDVAIREKDDLNKIFYDNVMDLKHRNLIDWIDMDNIWMNHINKRRNHSDALIVLASLEIHLKAQNK